MASQDSDHVKSLKALETEAGIGAYGYGEKKVEEETDEKKKKKTKKKKKDGDVEKEAKNPTVSFFKLFSYADNYDYVLMAIGTLGAIGHGMSLPMFFFLFGKLVDSFGSNQNDPKETAEKVGGVS